MTARAYYNEIDPYAAAWLRNLIAAGHIAPGEVDERSIADVRPDDLLGYVQCHFFAGIGVWSYALRRAGWDDQRPVWTGSCPCQPFSAAGRGEGFADERHLWPAFQHLIAQRRPPVVFGEQVASKAVDPWIDLVQDDMEGLGYAFGAVPFPSAGVGAPHIRDRAYFVAHAGRSCGQRRSDACRPYEAATGQRDEGPIHDQPRSGAIELADTGGCGLRRGREPGQDAGAAGSLPGEVREQRFRADVRADGSDGGLADASGEPGQRIAGSISRPQGQDDGRGNHGHRPGSAVGVMGFATSGGRERLGDQPAHGQPLQAGANAIPSIGHNSGPGPTNGFWRDPDWLHCRDGRWRPVEPGTFPLAHGAPARVGRLRAYGNAINAEAAAAFIAASMEACT